MGSSQPFPWRAEIGPPGPDPDARKPEAWVTKNREDRDSAIQATLRSFSIARQYLTETRFSSSERLIRFFEGVTASMSRNPSPDAFEFARRAFESVVRYGPNESRSAIAEQKEFEDGEARLLTLQAFHNLGVVHHRRWMQIWEEQTGFDARNKCAPDGTVSAPAEDCKSLKARELATLSYEAAHRYYECVITNSSREGEARGGYKTEIFFKPMMLTALADEDLWATKTLESARAEKKALDDQASEDSGRKPSKEERDAVQKALDKALAEKERSEKALKEMTSYRDSLFGRRLAVLLLASLGLLELIVQGRIRWKLGFELQGAPVWSARELNFDVLLRLSADLVKMAERFERIPSVEGIEVSGIEQQLSNLYSATPNGKHKSQNEGGDQEGPAGSAPEAGTEMQVQMRPE
jgi:hypothetical protein